MEKRIMDAINNALSALPQYKNERVIQSFLKTWDLPQAEAEDLFEETKKWLWLCATVERESNGSQKLAITEPTRLMDEMWHTFVLATREYRQFCLDYLVQVVEHQPTSEAEHRAQQALHAQDPAAFEAGQKAFLRWQYGQVLQYLGQETLIKWYDSWAERYTDEYLLQIWRWPYCLWGSALPAKVRLQLQSEESRPLSPEMIVKAWQDPHYRAQLPPAQLAQLPPHPAGDPTRYIRL